MEKAVIELLAIALAISIIFLIKESKQKKEIESQFTLEAKISTLRLLTIQLAGKFVLLGDIKDIYDAGAMIVEKLKELKVDIPHGQLLLLKTLAEQYFLNLFNKETTSLQKGLFLLRHQEAICSSDGIVNARLFDLSSVLTRTIIKLHPTEKADILFQLTINRPGAFHGVPLYRELLNNIAWGEYKASVRLCFADLYHQYASQEGVDEFAVTYAKLLLLSLE